MAAAALRAQLNAHITGMYTDGVVDEDTFEELRDEGTAVEVSRLFIYDASKIIDDIDILMEEPEVDFDEVEALTQHLMRCTSRSQLNAHIAGMYTEGVVDEDTFEELWDQGTTSREEPEVDFDEVQALTQQLTRCTSR
uniref:Histidine-containing phosphotransfer protein n=1 Tax=Triticum aestivum TaxID=4565 RepID=A0A3B6HXG2_WHEAT